MTLIKLFISLSILVNLAYSDPLIGGENVCNKTIMVRKDKTVNVPIKYEIKYQGMCGILPCTKTRTEVRIDSKLQPSLDEIQGATCCPGYAETPNRKCAPICLRSCNSGKCVRPGVCKCNVEPTETSPGFVGPTCNRYTCLAVDRWGANCDRECNCPENSYCSASTGKCLCRDGWRGSNCTEECDNSMNCEVFELPPIIDPEVNVIHDVISQSLKSESLTNYPEEDLTKSNLERFVLITVVATVGIFLVWLAADIIWGMLVKRARESVYSTSAYSTSSNGNDTTYSPYSDYFASADTKSSIQNRPRMPTPAEATFLNKNLSFASATRSILSKGNQAGIHLENRDKLLLDPKVESHLIASQKSSKQNLYSDVESNFSDRSYNIGECRNPGSTTIITSSIPEEKIVNISTSSAEENEYQVPKSPAQRTEPSCVNDIVVSPLQLSVDLYENDQYDNNDQNLYEEIKPRSPTNQKQ